MMSLKGIKIGKFEIEVPIFQGGMGVGISWDRLAGSVSKEGGLGIISAVGTGYYQDKRFVEREIAGRPYEAINFYSKEALKEIFKNARKICGDKPLGCNILYAMNDYGRVVRDACEAGADAIITGAGLPTNMPEFTEGYPDVALIPIISSAKALKIICKRWTKRYNRLPDAVIVEGPKSGGHQGFTYEQCFMEEFQLENLIAPIKEEIKNWGDFPLIAAGGIWDKKDIDKMISLGADGVQMGTRFIATHECDAHQNFKDVLMQAKEEDIKLLKSPVGYPARGVRTNLIKLVEKREGPAIKCISNCVAPCKRGEEAKEVGYCIADRLSDAYEGNVETGLFFTGSNGYRIKEIISVKELMDKLVNGEDDS
jgi:nitronate monooxygenase